MTTGDWLRLAAVVLGAIGLITITTGRFLLHRVRNSEWLSGALLMLLLVIAGVFPSLVARPIGFFTAADGGGPRLIGLIILAVVVLYGLVYLALARNRQLGRHIDRVVHLLAKREFRKLEGTVSAPIYVVVRADRQGASIEALVARIPLHVLGLKARAVVAFNSAVDGRGDCAGGPNQAATSLIVSREDGSAVRAAYELAIEEGAEIVVTLDAHGHRPEDIPQLVQPIVDGTADLVNGSRLLRPYERDRRVRLRSTILLNQLVSVLTLTRITDCANGFHAIRVSELSKLDLRRRPSHAASELLIDGLRKGLRVIEVPVTLEHDVEGATSQPPAAYEASSPRTSAGRLSR